MRGIRTARRRSGGEIRGRTRERADSRRSAGGHSLPELLVALVVAALLGTVAVSGYRSLSRSWTLSGAERVTVETAGRARLLAVAARATVRIRRGSAPNRLSIEEPDGTVREIELAPRGPGGIDSLRVRPATLRFNSRGQAAPGSIYLYQGGRGSRIVVNFLGRVRTERF